MLQVIYCLMHYCSNFVIYAMITILWSSSSSSPVQIDMLHNVDLQGFITLHFIIFSWVKALLILNMYIHTQHKRKCKERLI